ncbi:MAG: hypothetical protein COA33_007630 [Fluviicola sp.]|nr:hypothetical protein [Fluviicola sp.]
MKCKSNRTSRARITLLNSLTPVFVASIFLLTFLTPNTTFAQDSVSYSWENKGVIEITESETWALDAFDNLYISDDGIINKYDSDGTLMFSQSIKSLGRMTQMVLINTMKLVHFSEEQQTLCYFDNTLSPMDDCIDLAEEDIINASLVCSSDQPNKIWVLDNLNLTLNLLSLDGLNQSQQIKNLKGILDMDNIVQMKEIGNRLYLLDKSKGIYVFDMYGSLLEFIEEKSIQHFEVVGSTLFTLIDNSLHIHAIDYDDFILVNLPIDGVIELKAENEIFYLRTKNIVHKFKLVFN